MPLAALLAVAVTLTSSGGYEMFTNSAPYDIIGDVGIVGPLRGESVAFLCNAVRERQAVANHINYSGGTSWSYPHPPNSFDYYRGRFPSQLTRRGYALDDSPDDSIFDVRYNFLMATNIIDRSTPTPYTNVFDKVFAWGSHRTSDGLLILANSGMGQPESVFANIFPSMSWDSAYLRMFANGTIPFVRTFDYDGFWAAQVGDVRWATMCGDEIAHLLDDLHNNNALAFRHSYFGKTKTKYHEIYERINFSPGDYYPTYVPEDYNNPDKPYGYIGPPEWGRTLSPTNISYYKTTSNYTNANDTLFWRDSYAVERYTSYGWRGRELVSTSEGFEYRSVEAYTQPCDDGAPVITFDYALKDRIADVAAYGIFQVRANENTNTNLLSNPRQLGTSYRRLRQAYAMKKLPATKIAESAETGIEYQLSINWPTLAISIMTELGDTPPGAQDAQIKSAVVAPTSAPSEPLYYHSPTNYTTDSSAKASVYRNYYVEFVEVIGIAKLLYKARKAD